MDLVDEHAWQGKLIAGFRFQLPGQLSVVITCEFEIPIEFARVTYRSLISAEIVYVCKAFEHCVVLQRCCCLVYMDELEAHEVPVVLNM